MHLPSRSNSLFLIPKAGNRVLIRSDPTTKQLYPIRSEMILLDPKSEKFRSDRIRIGFGSDLHISSCESFGKLKNTRAAGECIFTLSESRATSQVHGSRYPARKTI